MQSITWTSAAQRSCRATPDSLGRFGVSATTRACTIACVSFSSSLFPRPLPSPIVLFPSPSSFHHVCFRYVRDGVPHLGYRYCSEWGACKKHGRFSVTSNIDGHWRRVMRELEVWECHGSVTHLQSSSCADGRIWSADARAMARASPPPWDLKPGDVVEVQLMKGSRHDCRLSAAERKGSWALATVADDSVSLILPKPSGSPSSSKLDHKQCLPQQVQVCAVRKPAGGQDLSRVADSSLLPRVPDPKVQGKAESREKGVLARPNVYMFGDRCAAKWCCHAPTDIH